MFSSKFFGRQLKVKRVERGWTQGDLAARAGVSLNTIARYETGATDPRFDAVCAIADAFNCSIDDFVK